jgi:hypothetical protein
MIVALLIVAILLVAIGLGVALADRLLATLAEHKASDMLSEPFGRPATVRVHGTPFLTQALRGRYDDIEVSGGGLVIGEMAGATLEAHLYDVQLPLRVLLEKRALTAVKLVCRRVEGNIVLPYGEIARVSRIPGLTLTYSDGRLLASAAVPVPGVSQIARLSGEAVLRVVSGDAVWLRVQHIAVAGISLPTLLIKQLLPALSVPIPLPELPYGLRLAELKPGPSGLIVTGFAESVVFTADRDAVVKPPA